MKELDIVKGAFGRVTAISEEIRAKNVQLGEKLEVSQKMSYYSTFALRMHFIRNSGDEFAKC